MQKELFFYALLITAVCLILPDGENCASLKQKIGIDIHSNDLAKNSKISQKHFNTDVQPLVFSDTFNKRALGSKRNDIELGHEVNKQINHYQSKNGFSKVNRPNLHIEKASDTNNNNVTEDGQLEKVKIENVLNLKTGKKDLVEILKFKSNENEDKNLQKQLNSHIELAKSISLSPLKMDELQPPDHVDGLRMEHDGHLNRDYKKEVLLGNHEEFEWESEAKLVNRLKDIFQKADTDHDGTLDLNELKSWIMINVEKHLNEAVADNKRIFSHLDTNSDDLVSWKEFYVHFLLAKGYDFESAKRQSTDYDTILLDPDEKEKLIRYKFRWAEADEEPQDNRLTFEEFMNFRHPEQSKTMLVRMVKDLIDNFDKNEDNVITEEEFAFLSPEVGFSNVSSDQLWILERRKEFREVVDLNKDGFVDEAELKVYVDPHNTNAAKIEAENLIRLADQDSDSRLSLNEVLENAELFLGSKVVDASRNFHDEF